MTTPTKEDYYALFVRRPGMIGAGCTLIEIQAFLAGYGTACDLNQFREDDPFLLDFVAFKGWVAHRLGFRESNMPWAWMISERHDKEKEKISVFFDLLISFRHRVQSHVANLNNCRLNLRENETYTSDIPKCPSSLSIFTYTSNAGFFVQSPEAGNQFSQEKFFPDLSALSRWEHITWDELQIIDNSWLPPQDTR